MAYKDDLIRDFTNAKGTRYIKMKWNAIGRDQDGLWFCLDKREGMVDYWVAGFYDQRTGVEVKFRIMPTDGALNALQAYRAAMDTYLAFVLGDEEAKKNFEVTCVATESETKH